MQAVLQNTESSRLYLAAVNLRDNLSFNSTRNLLLWARSSREMISETGIIHSSIHDQSLLSIASIIHYPSWKIRIVVIMFNISDYIHECKFAGLVLWWRLELCTTHKPTCFSVPMRRPYLWILRRCWQYRSKSWRTTIASAARSMRTQINYNYYKSIVFGKRERGEWMHASKSLTSIGNVSFSFSVSRIYDRSDYGAHFRKQVSRHQHYF